MYAEIVAFTEAVVGLNSQVASSIGRGLASLHLEIQ
jgi:hypothetical protein